jgi:hypothetical protein
VSLQLAPSDFYLLFGHVRTTQTARAQAPGNPGTTCQLVVGYVVYDQLLGAGSVAHDCMKQVVMEGFLQKGTDRKVQIDAEVGLSKAGQCLLWGCVLG